MYFITRFKITAAILVIIMLSFSLCNLSAAEKQIRMSSSEGLDVVPIENYGYAPILKHLIDNATSSILISMLEISDYEPVKTLLNSLISAKNRGIDVRIIYNGEFSSNKYAVNYLRNGGVYLKNDSYNPFLHTKLVIIDGHITYIGSHNWSPYAIGKNNEYGVIVFNKSIGKFYTDYFNSLWQNLNITPNLSNIEEYKNGLNVKTTYDGYTYNSLMNLIASAQTRLYIGMYSMGYYSNPSSSSEQWEDNLVNSIVQKKSMARVILDNHDSSAAYKYLVNNGVDTIYDSNSTITHLKLVIADNSVYIGDANWGAEYLDNETHTVGVIIHNSSIANFFASYFLTIHKYGDAPYYIPDGFVEQWRYDTNPGDALKINVYLANGGAINNTSFHIIPNSALNVELNETPSWDRTSVYDWINETAYVDIPSNTQGNYTISLTFYSKYYHVNYTMYFTINVSNTVPELNFSYFTILFALVPVFLRRR